MAISIRLDDEFVSNVKIHAEASNRSIPKQIEHWAKIDRIAEDNPDLPYFFIHESLLAKIEMDNGRVSKYVRRTKNRKLSVYEARRFEKALSGLSDDLLSVVEDEIEKIIDNLAIGEQKQGDLNFLRVHKFQLNNQFVLLGYCWVEDKIELHLLSLGSHENFYRSRSDIEKQI